MRFPLLNILICAELGSCCFGAWPSSLTSCCQYLLSCAAQCGSSRKQVSLWAPEDWWRNSEACWPGRSTTKRPPGRPAGGAVGGLEQSGRRGGRSRRPSGSSPASAPLLLGPHRTNPEGGQGQAAWRAQSDRRAKGENREKKERSHNPYHHIRFKYTFKIRMPGIPL